MLIKRFTGACKAADRRLSLSCVGGFQSAEWAVVKRLTDTDPVVDPTLQVDCLLLSHQGFPGSRAKLF